MASRSSMLRKKIIKLMPYSGLKMPLNVLFLNFIVKYCQRRIEIKLFIHCFSGGIKRSDFFMKIKLAFCPMSTKCLVTSVVVMALVSILCSVLYFTAISGVFLIQMLLITGKCS